MNKLQYGMFIGGVITLQVSLFFPVVFVSCLYWAYADLEVLMVFPNIHMRARELMCAWLLFVCL
jgi:hypothetical protein